jgi:hypothetical protein
MQWGWIVSTATVASGAAAFVAFLASVPFSPARFWSWQLRKHMETVSALAEDRHKAQREVLMRRADELASKAAAAQRIPTPWKRYVIGTAGWVFLGALTVNYIAIAHATLKVRWSDEFWESLPALIYLPVALLLCLGFAYKSTVVYVRYNARERARFIEEGCPADFATEPTVHERGDAWAEQERQRSLRRAAIYFSGLERAKRMKKAGVMPDTWPSHSRAVRAWRSLRSRR